MLRNLWPRTHVNILLVAVARCRGVGGWGGRWGGGNSQLNIVSSSGSCGSSGRPCLLWILVPGPRYALRLLSFRLAFGTTPIRDRVQSAVAPTYTPATKKQLWSGITSLAQLKEKERLAEPFSPFCLISQRVQLWAIGTMDKLFFFFNDKDMKKLPPALPMRVCHCMWDVKCDRKKSYV